MGKAYQGKSPEDVLLDKLRPSTEVYVSVYEVSRVYGGAEEGGWWTDHHAYTGESYTRRLGSAQRFCEQLQTKLDDDNPPRRGAKIQACVEARRGLYQTRARHRYE